MVAGIDELSMYVYVCTLSYSIENTTFEKEKRACTINYFISCLMLISNGVWISLLTAVFNGCVDL